MAGFCVIVGCMTTRRLLPLFFAIIVLFGILPWGVAQDDPAIAITAEDANRLGIATLLVQHTNTIVDIGFTPRGTAFYSAGFDSQYCVWNVDTRRDTLGELYFCATDYLAGASGVAWSLDEKRVAITGDNGTSIRIYRVYRPLPTDEWDVPEVTILATNNAVVLSLQFTTHHLLAFDTNDMFTLYDVRDGNVINQFEGIDATVSVDGSRIALTNFDGDIVLIDANSGDELDTLPVENVLEVAFSADNRWLATSTSDSTQLWSMTDDGYGRRINVDAAPQYLDFTPDNQYLVTWEDEAVRLWALSNGRLVGEMPEHDGGVSAAEFTPDTTRAITIDNFGNGRIWRINEDGSAERLLLLRDKIDRIYIAPDSVSVIVARIDFFARFYDIQRAQLRGQYTMPPDSAMSPDWTLMATIDNNIITWHTLPNDPRELAFPPIAITRDAINIRQTPNTDFARIATIPANTPVFALGRLEDNQWLRVVLPDGTRGWTFVSGSLALQGDVGQLPLIQPEATTIE